MAEEEAPDKPSVICLIVHVGSHIVTPNPDALVYLTMQLGSEKFNTDAKKKPSPDWGEKCELTVKHSFGFLASRPSDTVIVYLKEQSGSTVGTITLPVAKLGPEPKKQWGVFVTTDGSPSPGKLQYECWVKEYAPHAKAKRGSLLESLTPGSPRKHKKSVSMDGSAAAVAALIGTPASGPAATKPKADDSSSHLSTTESAERSLSTHSSYGGPVPMQVSSNQPDISGIRPSTGPASGGTSVTIRGTNFGRDRDDITELTVAGQDCLGTLTYISPSQLQFFTLPTASKAREGPIVVCTASGGRSVPGPSFTYTPQREYTTGAPPEVTGISPRSGPAGGSIQIRVLGSNLALDREDLVGLYICGVDHLSSVTSVSRSMISCTARPGKGCGAVVVVTRSGGVGTSTVTYTYEKPLTMRPASTVDEPPAEKPVVLPEKKIDAMSKLQLEVEVHRLRERVAELEKINADQKDYIDRILCQLFILDPSGAALEHAGPASS